MAGNWRCDSKRDVVPLIATVTCLLFLCQCARAERPFAGRELKAVKPATQQQAEAKRLHISAIPHFGAFMELTTVRVGDYTLVFFCDDDSPDKVPFVLAVRHDGDLALDQPLATSKLLPLTIRSECDAVTVELLDPHPVAGEVPLPSEIQFSVNGTPSNRTIMFALAQGEVFTVGLDGKSETLDVRQLPREVFNDDLLPKDDTSGVDSQSKISIDSWWQDVLRTELGPEKQILRKTGDGVSEIRQGPVDRSHQKSSEVDPATPSAIAQDKGTAKCNYVESTGVHHTHPVLDMRGPLIVRARLLPRFPRYIRIGHPLDTGGYTVHCSGEMPQQVSSPFHSGASSHQRARVDPNVRVGGT